MSSKLPVVLFLTAVLIAAVVGTTIPVSNALIQRNFDYLNDQHLTARYGNTKVCGDHLCTPGEFAKMQAQLTASQLGHQGGRNATQTAVVPTMPAAPSAPAPTISSSVCQPVKSILSGAGVSSTVMAKVMADLGCS
jgi:hypothetical protein